MVSSSAQLTAHTELSWALSDSSYNNFPHNLFIKIKIPLVIKESKDDSSVSEDSDSDDESLKTYRYVGRQEMVEILANHIVGLELLSTISSKNWFQSSEKNAFGIWNREWEKRWDIDTK